MSSSRSPSAATQLASGAELPEPESIINDATSGHRFRDIVLRGPGPSRIGRDAMAAQLKPVQATAWSQVPGASSNGLKT